VRVGLERRRVELVGRPGASDIGEVEGREECATSRGVGVHFRGAPDGEAAPDSWSGASV